MHLMEVEVQSLLVCEVINAVSQSCVYLMEVEVQSLLVCEVINAVSHVCTSWR